MNMIWYMIWRYNMWYDVFIDLSILFISVIIVRSWQNFARAFGWRCCHRPFSLSSRQKHRESSSSRSSIFRSFFSNFTYQFNTPIRFRDRLFTVLGSSYPHQSFRVSLFPNCICWFDSVSRVSYSSYAWLNLYPLF
jgi:hypothetical protein